jgi:hypothetical protein
MNGDQTVIIVHSTLSFSIPEPGIKFKHSHLSFNPMEQNVSRQLMKKAVRPQKLN